MDLQTDIAVIGGGAAGFFGAITAAETARKAGRPQRVMLLEAAPQPLAKVRISGGGRCNLTHHCFEPRELITRYPRGGRELLGPFHRFGPRDTITWFGDRGVHTKAEADGRMFPVTDRSSSVIECLQRSAERAGVDVRTRCGVKALEREDGGFRLVLSTGETLLAGKVLLATGGTRGTAGHGLAAALGHTIVTPVPSLFTFHVRDPRLEGLAGVAVPVATAAVSTEKLRSEGPLLVTHEGLSGPAVLRLSAWGARCLAQRDYRFPVVFNFLPGKTPETLAAELSALRTTHGKRALHTWSPAALPSRLWERLVSISGATSATTWSNAPKPLLQALAGHVCAAEFTVTGKSLNKDEFVTCGGVALDEVDFQRLESRRVPGLHLAGEVLDIDGVTGGFNFQAAWTTGWHAGRAMAGVVS